MVYNLCINDFMVYNFYFGNFLYLNEFYNLCINDFKLKSFSASNIGWSSYFLGLKVLIVLAKYHEKIVKVKAVIIQQLDRESF